MKSIKKCLCILIAASTLYCASTSQSWANKPTRVESQQAINWLQQKNFNALEDHLEKLHQLVRQDPQQEYQLHWTYQALADDWKNSQSAVSQWLSAHPSSLAAKMVWSGQALNQAWNIRGSSYADKVPEKDMLAFNEKLLTVETAVREVLDKQPSHPFANTLLAMSSCPQGSHDCIAELVVRLDEQAPSAYFARRRLLRFLEPQWSGTTKAVPSYIQHLKSKLDQYPFWAPLMQHEALNYCTNANIKKNRPQDALEQCRHVLKAPADDFYADRIAYSLLDLGAADELQAYIQKLLNEKPSDWADRTASDVAEKITTRASRLVKEKKFEEAEKLLNTALAISGKTFTSETDLGRIYFAQGKTEQAQLMFRKAVERKPEGYYAYEWYVYSLRDSGKELEALPFLQEFVSRNQKVDKAYFELAKLAYIQRDLPSTWTNVNEACRLGHANACEWKSRLASMPGIRATQR